MEKRTTDHGYIEMYLPEHPLSNKSGWCLEHRAVLHDATTPGEQPCYWCGWLLPWRGGYKNCVNVDHLNEDRTDNRLTNLVPSCWWCNTNRSWSRVAPLIWARARREFGSIPPNERPNMIHWLAARAEETLRLPPPPKSPVTGRALLGRAAIDRLAEAFPNNQFIREDDWLGKIPHDHLLNPKLPEVCTPNFKASCERWAEHLARGVQDKVITEGEARDAWARYVVNVHPEEIDLSELTDNPLP